MRSSDWSSDVCSSDLESGFAPAPQRLFELRDAMLDKRGQQAGERRAVIALIGIDADPRVGPRGADRRDAQYIFVEVAGQLDLDRRLRVDRQRRLCHGLDRKRVV